MNTLKDLVGNRLFSNSNFSWLIEKINRQCRDVLAFSFLKEFQGEAWSDAFLQRFRNRYKDSEPKMLVIFLNVGRFSENQNNITRNIPFIGEYYNDSKKRYSACHFSLLVYHFPTNKCFYCDSLGWNKPIFIKSYIEELILSMTNKAKQINIVECHSNRNNSNLRHACIPSKCATYFPLQSCGSICGASASICGALAVFRYDLFEKLCKCTGKDTTSTLKNIGYLKNVSLYGPFLRVVFMKCFLNGIIDIGDIVGPENEIPVKVISKIILNSEDSVTANSKQSEKNSLQEKQNFKRKGNEVVLDKFLVYEKKTKKNN